MQLAGHCAPALALFFTCFSAPSRGVRLLSLRRGNRSSSSIPSEYRLQLENFQNVQYFGEFTAGGQTLPIIYDTGSFEVILLSTLCKHCEHGAPIYDAQRSSTFRKGEDIVAQHVFGSGPVKSRKGLEDCIVGPSSSPLKAPSMPFWQVMDHRIDVWDKHSRFSGIIGLGHTGHAPSMQRNQDGSRDTANTDTTLLERVGVHAFSICLERGSATPPGWLSLGSNIDSASSSSTYRHVPVVGEIHWGVQMTNLRAGGFEAHPGYDYCSPSCAAIIDSGTSLITAPRGALEELLPVLGAIKKDCSNLDQLPDITFKLGNDHFNLPPAIYVVQLKYWQEKPRSIFEIFSPVEYIQVTECMPAFMQMDKRTAKWGPVWILGMPFLRYHSVVFDRSPKSVHIAYADSNCNPTTSKPANMHSSGTSVNTTVNGPPTFAASPSLNGTARGGDLRHNVTTVSLPKAAGSNFSASIRVPEWMHGQGDLAL